MFYPTVLIITDLFIFQKNWIPLFINTIQNKALPV
jgi:hypothetical protein